ncbi:hypothetical protein C8R45DRAFT_525630 [Mycena sanguinolenta]|nr:hypothetical protein C8R45DRAFT_525630 [Mycena sanguinolenta]
MWSSLSRCPRVTQAHRSRRVAVVSSPAEFSENAPGGRAGRGARTARTRVRSWARFVVRTPDARCLSRSTGHVFLVDPDGSQLRNAARQVQSAGLVRCWSRKCICEARIPFERCSNGVEGEYGGGKAVAARGAGAGSFGLMHWDIMAGICRAGVPGLHGAVEEKKHDIILGIIAADARNLRRGDPVSLGGTRGRCGGGRARGVSGQSGGGRREGVVERQARARCSTRRAFGLGIRTSWCGAQDVSSAGVTHCSMTRSVAGIRGVGAYSAHLRKVIAPDLERMCLRSGDPAHRVLWAVRGRPRGRCCGNCSWSPAQYGRGWGRREASPGR